NEWATFDLNPVHGRTRYSLPADNSASLGACRRIVARSHRSLVRPAVPGKRPISSASHRTISRRQWTNLTDLCGAVAGPLKREVPAAPDLIECRLSDLPLLTYSERDGAPYFTSAMFVAEEPETGVPNLSFHRSMYISDEELRCRLAPRHHLT